MFNTVFWHLIRGYKQKSRKKGYHLEELKIDPLPTDSICSVKGWNERRISPIYFFNSVILYSPLSTLKTNGTKGVKGDRSLNVTDFFWVFGVPFQVSRRHDRNLVSEDLIDTFFLFEDKIQLFIDNVVQTNIGFITSLHFRGKYSDLLKVIRSL